MAEEVIDKGSAHGLYVSRGNPHPLGNTAVDDGVRQQLSCGLTFIFVIEKTMFQGDGHRHQYPYQMVIAKITARIFAADQVQGIGEDNLPYVRGYRHRLPHPESRRRLRDSLKEDEKKRSHHKDRFRIIQK
jgi:hypothetical protein